MRRFIAVLDNGDQVEYNDQDEFDFETCEDESVVAIEAKKIHRQPRFPPRWRENADVDEYTMFVKADAENFGMEGTHETLVSAIYKSWIR